MAIMQIVGHYLKVANDPKRPHAASEPLTVQTVGDILAANLHKALSYGPGTLGVPDSDSSLRSLRNSRKADLAVRGEHVAMALDRWAFNKRTCLEDVNQVTACAALATKFGGNQEVLAKVQTLLAAEVKRLNDLFANRDQEVTHLAQEIRAETKDEWLRGVTSVAELHASDGGWENNRATLQSQFLFDGNTLIPKGALHPQEAQRLGAKGDHHTAPEGRLLDAFREVQGALPIRQVIAVAVTPASGEKRTALPAVVWLQEKVTGRAFGEGPLIPVTADTWSLLRKAQSNWYSLVETENGPRIGFWRSESVSLSGGALVGVTPPAMMRDGRGRSLTPMGLVPTAEDLRDAISRSQFLSRQEAV
jgi:hypothetical protein